MPYAHKEDKARQMRGYREQQKEKIDLLKEAYNAMLEKADVYYRFAMQDEGLKKSFPDELERTKKAIDLAFFETFAKASPALQKMFAEDLGRKIGEALDSSLRKHFGKFLSRGEERDEDKKKSGE